MKLWDKGYSIDQLIEEFTVGKDRSIDLEIAYYDVQASKAHAQMLWECNLLQEQEWKQLNSALAEFTSLLQKEDFAIELDYEDIHSKLEAFLIEKTGEAGKKIHTARSRNDQVLVAMHLYAKNELQEVKTLVKTLFETLIDISEAQKDMLIPGYTHMQIAMPSSIGMWLSGFAELLVDDCMFLNAAYAVANQNPLGSAAGFGSSMPIQRKRTTELLDFAVLKYNATAAQMSRSKMERSIQMGLSSLAFTLSKLCMDICQYTGQNFGFIQLPKELGTGSSIMPHKNNPDVFELVRGQCNKIQGSLQETILLSNNLPSGYHREFQLLKEGIIENFKQIKSCLRILNYALPKLKYVPEILQNPMYDYVFSVEKVNALVLEGKSFREAYKTVGKSILEGSYVPDTSVHHSHEGSIGNLCLKEITKKFNTVYSTLD